MPLVTVVTVVRNCASTIGQCIDSVLDQNYENLEYLVIDGVSTDGTFDIIREHEDAVDYFVSEPDSGIYDAMNKGLKLASGEFVLFLNADDWYEANAVKELVNCAQQTGACIAHADAWLVGESGTSRGILKGWLSDAIYTLGMPLRHETMLVSRDTYETVGAYDESYKIIADYEWTIRAYQQGTKFAHLDEALLWFRLTGISNTQHSKRIAERQRLFLEVFPFLDDVDALNIAEQVALTPRQKQSLIKKYKDKSEMFAISMACNIEQEQSAKSNSRALSVLRPIRNTIFWPWISRTLNRIRSLGGR